MAKTLTQLTVRAVDAHTWPDFVRLFEARGGPKNCWCMLWRARGAEAKRMRKADRKAAMERRVDRGTPIGLLGYLEGQPVAWCSIAPRPTYRPLGGIVDPGEDSESVWSIVCFYIARPHRDQGVMTSLLYAAVDHARKQGAKVVEAYPVDSDSPSYRFMGFVDTFESAGFREVGRAGKRRHVMRLDLGRSNRKRRQHK